MGLNLNGNIITSKSIGPEGQSMLHIIRDGLVLYLDAANLNSYPGSGTAWYDLSPSGYNGTLYGGTTYTTNNGYGVIQLNGSGCYVGVPSLNLSSSNFTVIAGTRYTATGGGRIISAWYNNWLLGHWSNSIANYYSVGWVSSVGAGGTDTNWRIYAGTGNISSGVYSMYIDGVLNISGGGGTAGPNGLSIGMYGPGTSEFSNGQVSFVLAYNRVLSQSEIIQTYNALSNRLGGAYYNCGYGCQYYTYNPGCTLC
jgi:hypothetical protein